MKHSFQIFDRLKNSGIPAEQARVIVEAIEEVTDPTMKDLATKADLKDFATKSDLKALEGSMGRRMDKMESDISWLKSMFFSFMVLIVLNIGLSFFHH